MAQMRTMNGENMKDVNLLSEIGENLRKLRLRKRMSQQEVADKLGSAKSYVSDIENGKRNFKMETLRQFCVILDVAPATLFRFRERKADSKSGQLAENSPN